MCANCRCSIAGYASWIGAATAAIASVAVAAAATASSGDRWLDNSICHARRVDRRQIPNASQAEF